MFTQALAREIGSRGITVNNVSRSIDTDLNPAAGDWARASEGRHSARPLCGMLTRSPPRWRFIARSGVLVNYRVESYR